MGERRWWPRVMAAVLGLAFAFAPAAPALAHTVGGVAATNFQTTLSAVTPAVPGLSLQVIENGSRLELRNGTGTEVTVAGYGGEPYARVGPAGVFLNDNSPATYLNTDRFSTAAVPMTADGRGPAQWRQVATERVWRWHDHRVHWMLKTLPPAVAADPGAPHQISAWTVVLVYGDQRLTATGTLDWVPGPSPWPWFGLVALVAVAVAGAAYLAPPASVSGERSESVREPGSNAAVPHRALAAALALLFLAGLGHGLGAMAITAGTLPQKLSALVGADSLLIWPFAVLTAWLLWRRHTRAAWLAAGIGALAAIEMVLDDAPVWWRSSAPSALPPTLNRVTVALVVGIGVGLILALPLLLRRHPPKLRPWPGATAPAAAPSESAPDDAEPVPAEGFVVGRRQMAGLLAAGAVGALTGGTVGATLGSRASVAPATTGPLLGDVGARSIAFRGDRQAGIVSPARPQAHAWVAGFDLEPGVGGTALRDLLQRWSDTADRLMAGQPLGATDDAVVAGLGPAALTVTVGFGPSLFGKGGIPATARPDALAPLPAFAGEQLDRSRSDGDLGVVVSSDDPLVTIHAGRVLRRLAAGTAKVRWQMSGFNAARGTGSDAATGRNLMGHVDGTNNPQPIDPDFATRIFVGSGAGGPGTPAWLRGGSYLVVRRIRMLLDAWDMVPATDQERVIGRRRDNGAPLTGGDERAAADFGARAADGSLVIPSDAHMRLAAPAANEGAAILRRGFSYVDGDESGLLFLAWQADPRRGFIPVQQRLVAADALRRFIRHESSALFAMPGGVQAGAYIGQALLESS